MTENFLSFLCLVSRQANQGQRQKVRQIMKRMVAGLLLVFASGAALAQDQGSQYQAAFSAVARIFNDMTTCQIDKATQCLVTDHANDWLKYVQSGDASMPNTKNKSCGVSVEMGIEMICDSVACADHAPPRSEKTDCSVFTSRLRAMRIVKPDWTVTEALK